MDMSVKLGLSYPAVTPASSSPVADKPVSATAAPQADPVTPVSATSKDADSDSSARLKKAVQDIEKFVQSIKRNLEFSIDEHSGKVVVKVIASDTGEVVRQIPTAEAMKLADSLSSASSVLFDAKA